MSPLLSAGLELMLVGMGTVFFFLTLLVFVTRMMSQGVQRFFPQIDQAVSQLRSQADEEVAAIAAAIARHRRR